MLDLDKPELNLPKYKVKHEGKEYEYDTMVLGYKLQALAGVEDPEEIQKRVSQILGIEGLSPYQAALILKDYQEFAKKEADEPLKKVFGRSLFSDTTSDSAPEKSES